AVPEGANLIKKVNYRYVDKSDAEHTGSITPVEGENIVDLPYGAKSFEITGYEKNYSEQAVTFYNGGIRRGAKLIVSANKDKVSDVTYTLTPVMPEFDTKGKLKSLKFQGTEIPNFKPYVYNYMVNVTAEPTAADFTYEAYNSATVTKSSLDKKKKQITLTVSGGEKYSVCWYYSGDGNPFDFSGEWVKAKYNGFKPSSVWTIPGDCADAKQWGIGAIKFDYKTGNEVMSSGENGVLLQTVHGASLAGSVPGMMTMGTMSLSLGTNGGTTSSISESASKGYSFRNTPDSVAMFRKEVAKESVTGWSFRIKMSDGTNLSDAATISGSYSELNVQKYVNVALKYPNNPVSRFTVTMNAAHTESAASLKKGLSGTIYTSAVQLSNIHFVYNSDLTAATVNGKTTVKSGNTFTCTLGAGEEIIGLPALKFTGAVHDQTQVIRWMDNGEWKKGVLKARVTNFGENSTDSTVYIVQIKRAAVTDLTYTRKAFKRNGITYPTTTSNDTVYVNLPFGTKLMPDLDITPSSIHQLIDVEKKANEIKVTVTNENDVKRDTVYVFREV
ncbi:MAG: hypothetical protein IKS76_05840, partial [Paludibacteraceae bacterium]|nr:hypothetical protein [Paludibacteraceae bacterium]